MVKPSQKEQDKLAKVNKPTAKSATTKTAAKKVSPKPQAKAKATPAKATVNKPIRRRVAVLPSGIGGLSKKISTDEIKQATQHHTLHEDHLEVAKLAYQHLQTEDGFAKPPTPPKQNDKAIHPLEPMEPSIPVYSVAVAPAVVTKVPAPLAPSIPLNKPQSLPTTKDGKLKWSDIKDKLPRS